MFVAHTPRTRGSVGAPPRGGAHDRYGPLAGPVIVERAGALIMFKLRLQGTHLNAAAPSKAFVSDQLAPASERDARVADFPALGEEVAAQERGRHLVHAREVGGGHQPLANWATASGGGRGPALAKRARRDSGSGKSNRYR